MLCGRTVFTNDNIICRSSISIDKKSNFCLLELHSKDPVNEPLRPYKPRQDISMPDVITVRIDEGI